LTGRKRERQQCCENQARRNEIRVHLLRRWNDEFRSGSQFAIVRLESRSNTMLYFLRSLEKIAELRAYRT
jgi:hypothetical protein